MKEWYSAGQEMVAMSPGNWAPRRIVHPCREGCCLSRAEAVDRIVTLACRVVLHSCICVPAENKWLSIYPVMMDVCLMSAWFGFLQYAEEFINGNLATPVAAAATEDDFIYQDWAKTRTAYTRRAAKMIHAPDCLARMMFSLIVLTPMMKVILEIVGSTFLRDRGQHLS